MPFLNFHGSQPNMMLGEIFCCIVSGPCVPPENEVETVETCQVKIIVKLKLGSKHTPGSHTRTFSHPDPCTPAGAGDAGLKGWQLGIDMPPKRRGDTHAMEATFVCQTVPLSIIIMGMS